MRHVDAELSKVLENTGLIGAACRSLGKSVSPRDAGTRFGADDLHTVTQTLDYCSPLNDVA